MDKQTYAVLKKKIDNVTENIDEVATQATEAWLEDNVSPETGYVLDRSLTLNDAAAPADLVGDLKTALSFVEDGYTEKKHDDALWKAGYWAIANGSFSSKTNWVCSNQTIPSTIVSIETKDTYNMYLQAFDSNGYVGSWNGSAFTTTYSKNYGLQYINFEKFRREYPNYIFKVTAELKTSATVTPATFSSDTVVEYSIPKKLNIHLMTMQADFFKKELWENGAITGQGTKVSDSDYSKRVSNIDFFQFIFPVTIIPKSGYLYSVTTYNKSGTKESQFGSWQTAPFTFTSTEKLYRIAIRQESNSVISPYNIANYMEAFFLRSMPFNRVLSEYANVKAVNHRGYCGTAPENTLPAFELSASLGYKYVECDVRYTSDGVAVLMHDATINRTARNPNGSTIESSISIDSITYEQALEYDYGIFKGEQYAGTKIPTFSEFMNCCKALNLHPYIELKDDVLYTAENIGNIISIIKSNGMEENVSFISFSYSALALVAEAWETVELGLNGTVANAQLLRTGKNRVFMLYTYSANYDAAIEAGFQVMIYNVDDVGDITGQSRNGFDSVLTNNLIPSQVNDAVRYKYEHSND